MATRHLCRVGLTGVVAAVLLIPSVAVASPTLELGPVAREVAGSAAVGVPVSVLCGGPDQANPATVFVQLSQAVGDVVASGSGVLETLSCDGIPQQVEIPVVADPGSRPFRAGMAFAQAAFSSCPPAPPTPPGDGGSTPAPQAMHMPPSPEPGSPEPVGPQPGPAPGNGSVACDTASVSAEVFILPSMMGEHL